MQAEAAAYWQDWLEGGRDVPGLRLHTITLIERMRQASQNEDWDQLGRLFEAYSYPGEYCQDEPLLTVYENGLMYINTELADSMWIRGELERALEHIEWVQQTLDSGDIRRAEAGMVPRPNSELRYQCIGIKSACCLEQAALFSTGSPELETSMMASEFWRLAEAAVSYLLEKGSAEDDRARTVLHGLARWELELCKLCERYCPAFLAVAIDFFNARIGRHLEETLRHFETLGNSDERSAWYWDFELSKLETVGEYNRAEVLLCSSQRSASARLSYAKNPALALQGPWARQVSRMLSAVSEY